MNSAWRANWKFIKWCLAGIALLGGLFALMFFCGCVPPFTQKYVECGVVAGQVLQKHADNPELIKSIGKALEKNGEKVLTKIGRCGELINAENVVKKLGESGEEADRAGPWYNFFGGGLIDWALRAVIGMVLGYLGIKKGFQIEGSMGAPLRRLFHRGSHWEGYEKETKGDGNEVRKS